MCYALTALLPFSSRKVFIILTWSELMIYLFRVNIPVLALICGNCPLTFQLRSYFVFLQELPSFEVFCKKGCSWRFPGLHLRALLFQSLFNKATCQRACGFIEGRLQRECLSCTICEIFESTYIKEHLPTTASVSLNLFSKTFCKLYLLFNVRNIFYLLN